MVRIFCWCMVLLIYWAVVVHFLRSASPIFIDGAGPMPSFQWGHLPQPNLSEFTRRRDYYLRIYSLPYYLAGLVITTIGCSVAFWTARRVQPVLSRVCWSSAALTLALLLLLALASDVGNRMGAWRGPYLLLHEYYDPVTIWALCKMLLPSCVLSGVVAIGHRLISMRPPFDAEITRAPAR